VTTVFLLVLYLGQAQQESNMMFADINRCKYFAARVMKQPANPQTKKRYTAICRPVEVDLSNPKVRVYRWKDINVIERYLNEFLMTQENDPLLKERYIDYERDATGKADGKKEIGFGHTYNPDKKFFTAVTKDGKEYKIPVKRKIPGGATKTYLTFQESKDVARKDAMIHRDSARKTIKNFDELPEELKMVATDIDLNVKGKFNTFSELKKGLENLDFDVIKNEYERSGKIKGKQTLLDRRNKPTLKLIKDAEKKVNFEYPPTQAKREEPKEIEVEVSDIEPPKSFKQAFAEARANKDAEFTYSGSRYNTRLKGETPQQYAAFLGKDMPVQVARKGGMVIKNYKERT